MNILLKNQQVTSINDYFLVDVDQFYGIEYEEFPSQIAQVAMWLIDHQMNEASSGQFGEYYKRIPLKKSATIVCGNALRIDWQSLLKPIPWEKEELKYDYIFGNPPFIGHQLRNKQQVDDMNHVFDNNDRSGRLDYVTCWFKLASKYMKLHPVTVSAFVSTNSITQGEQASILWKELNELFNINIFFCHKTFAWGNEAKDNAAVHVVIIGFAIKDMKPKRIFEYENLKSEAHEILANNINAYLVDGKNVFIESRGNPIDNRPKMSKGSQPTDGGNLILSEEEKQTLSQNSELSNYIKKYVGAYDLLNNKKRYCLWFVDVKPNELKSFKEIKERLENVIEIRKNSPTPSVKECAETPYLFTQIRQPKNDYLVIPETSSENRKYIPIAYLSKDTIASNSLQIISSSSLFIFGIIQSKMHFAWAKITCGRLKSDFRYTPSVYNNFPWPENPTDKQKETVEKAAQAVLDARAQFPESSLADLYDPNTMPPVLVKAHHALDKAVDLCYRPQPFPNEAKRIEFLFELYDKYTAGLFVQEKKGKKKEKKEVKS